MTKGQFDAAYRAFCGRHPFRTFLIEFLSGSQISVGHQEAAREEADIYVMRLPDGGYVLFSAESVVRLLDMPTATSN